jgi:hypothetical protein
MMWMPLSGRLAAGAAMNIKHWCISNRAISDLSESTIPMAFNRLYIDLWY